MSEKDNQQELITPEDIVFSHLTPSLQTEDCKYFKKVCKLDYTLLKNLLLGCTISEERLRSTSESPRERYICLEDLEDNLYYHYHIAISENLLTEKKDSFGVNVIRPIDWNNDQYTAILEKMISRKDYHFLVIWCIMCNLSSFFLYVDTFVHTPFGASKNLPIFTEEKISELIDETEKIASFCLLWKRIEMTSEVNKIDNVMFHKLMKSLCLWSQLSANKKETKTSLSKMNLRDLGKIQGKSFASFSQLHDIFFCWSRLAGRELVMPNFSPRKKFFSIGRIIHSLEYRDRKRLRNNRLRRKFFKQLGGRSHGKQLTLWELFSRKEPN